MSERVFVYDPVWRKMPGTTMYKGEIHDYSVDADMWCSRDGGTTLSSAVWSVADGNNISIGADSEASNVSTAAITASSRGKAQVKVVLTLADGQAGVQWIYFNIVDPKGDTGDYL